MFNVPKMMLLCEAFITGPFYSTLRQDTTAFQCCQNVVEINYKLALPISINIVKCDLCINT